MKPDLQCLLAFWWPEFRRLHSMSRYNLERATHWENRNRSSLNTQNWFPWSMERVFQTEKNKKNRKPNQKNKHRRKIRKWMRFIKYLRLKLLGRSEETYLFLSSCSSMCRPPTVIAYFSVSGRKSYSREHAPFLLPFSTSFRFNWKKKYAIKYAITFVIRWNKNNNLSVPFSGGVKSHRFHHLRVRWSIRLMTFCGENVFYITIIWHVRHNQCVTQRPHSGPRPQAWETQEQATNKTCFCFFHTSSKGSDCR